MNTVSMETLVKSIISEFNQRHNHYKNELSVWYDGMTLYFDFKGVTSIQSVSDYDVDDLDNDSIFWLNITNLFTQLIAVYERDHLDESLNVIAKDIKSKLIDLSKVSDTDMNTIWIAFKESMICLENELKKDYLQ